MARLETLHGVQVNVTDEKVERLLATGGYRQPESASTKSTSTRKPRAKSTEK